MDPKKLSLQELLQLCLATQDPALWQEFVRRFQPLIAGVVKKTLRRWPWIYSDPALVDDLTQDTFMKLCANDFRALREFHFEQDNSLYSFLKTVASNVAQDYLRREYSPKHGGGVEEVDLDDAMIPARPVDAHTQILLAEIQRILEEELGHEPNFRRDIAIFWLYYRWGLTAKEISGISWIGLTVKGVESVLLRLTRLIRGRLGGRGTASGR